MIHEHVSMFDEPWLNSTTDQAHGPRSLDQANAVKGYSIDNEPHASLEHAFIESKKENADATRS
jgi:hypothetical protein